jgi:two-component system response regulator
MAVVEGVEILLVEDSEDDAELTMRAIRNNKIANRIELARDGVEALAYLEGDRPLPRLVLLDLKLPRMNGLDVLRRIRSNPKTRVLPIVVLTSSREEPDIAAAYELGVNSYIVKPVEFDDFVKAVTEAGLYWLLLNEPPRSTR